MNHIISHLGEAECEGEADKPDEEEDPLLERPENWTEALLEPSWIELLLESGRELRLLDRPPSPRNGWPPIEETLLLGELPPLERPIGLVLDRDCSWDLWVKNVTMGHFGKFYLVATTALRRRELVGNLGNCQIRSDRSQNKP